MKRIRSLVVYRALQCFLPGYSLSRAETTLEKMDKKRRARYRHAHRLAAFCLRQQEQ